MAFELLFHRYKNRLKGFVRSIAPPQVEAEEIVQKVFIKVWLQREKIDPTKSFPSFLFTVAKNELIDQLRQAVNKRLYFVGDELLIDLEVGESTAEDERNQLAQSVLDLIQKLPERRRQIFELSRFHGLSYKQIAAQTGITENTVDTQIRHALKYLREEVARLRLVLLFIFSK